MGKITVITGGTSGIGRGIAEKILAESAKTDRIFVTYGHDEKKALSFQESLPEEKRSQVTLIKADMSSYEEMMVFVEELKKQTDHIDWLVSNAGISTYAKYEDYSFEEWTRIVNTNLSVPVFMVKELRSMMVEGGSVLFTGSYAGQQAYSSSLVYGVTKAAIHFLTRSLVKEFEPKGITVNAIALHRNSLAQRPHPGELRPYQPEDRTPQIWNCGGSGGYGVCSAVQRIYERQCGGYPRWL